MKISALNWKYTVREYDEEYRANHHLIAADTSEEIRIAVYAPCWSPSPAGTALAFRDVLAWVPGLNALDAKYQQRNVDRLCQFIVANHEHCPFETMTRLLNELPPVEYLAEVAA